ncbi:MAG TPA: polysaccharide deacetylase, partial [Roseiarcus sp.]|nr:polysaccharide deacetylase [Roseiarcus sp.]
MDAGRNPDSTSRGPVRDLIGNGRRRPNPHGPGEARVAVQFAINYEEGSEYTIVDGDGRTEAGLAESPGG